MSFGWGELLVVLAIGLLIAGGRRLPEIGKALGQSIREFQRAMRGGSDETDQANKKDQGPSTS
jgi:sec-independent protein translocase protein TatA